MHMVSGCIDHDRVSQEFWYFISQFDFSPTKMSQCSKQICRVSLREINLTIQSKSSWIIGSRVLRLPGKDVLVFLWKNTIVARFEKMQVHEEKIPCSLLSLAP